MMRLNENKLMLDLLCAEKTEGMEQLFRCYYKPLVVFARSFLLNLEDAEDLVQDQLVKLWQKKVWGDLIPEAFSTFLFTVIRNACLDHLEKKRPRFLSLDNHHFQIAEKEAENLSEETVIYLKEVINQLPERTRLAMEAVFLKGEMYKEAAENLGVSVNTIKTLLRLGVQELRKKSAGKEELLLLVYYTTGYSAFSSVIDVI